MQLNTENIRNRVAFFKRSQQKKKGSKPSYRDYCNNFYIFYYISSIQNGVLFINNINTYITQLHNSVNRIIDFLKLSQKKIKLSQNIIYNF